MKTTTWIRSIVLVGIIALAGCSKQKPTAPVLQGVTIDSPRLREAFSTASPELQTAAAEVAMGVRYHDYPRAMAGLDKLANTPSLTEPQKKVVGEVTEQVKQAAAKDTAQPAR